MRTRPSAHALVPLYVCANKLGRGVLLLAERAPVTAMNNPATHHTKLALNHINLRIVKKVILRLEGPFFYHSPPLFQAGGFFPVL